MCKITKSKKYKYQAVFSARFDWQIEDDQILDEIEIYINLNINRDITESDIENIDVRSQSKHEIQNQVSKV